MPAPLKYLFIAEYNDGTQFYQMPDDTSKTRAGGSAFTDVEQDRLVLFRLYSVEDDGENVYEVDLRDGAFRVNGARFFAHPDGLFEPGQHFDLLFFRKHREELEFKTSEGYITGIAQKKEAPLVYIIGWKTKLDGLDVQRTLEFT